MSAASIVLCVVVGAVAGGGFAWLLGRLAPLRRQELYALSLVYIAAIYVGPAVGHYTAPDAAEFLVSLAFIAPALAGLRGHRVVLACGYLGHGLWDAAHGVLVPAALPAWYGPMCLGFDWMVAFAILRGWPRGVPARRAERAVAVGHSPSGGL